MRTLSATLLAAQKEHSLSPLPRITLSKTGESDVVLDKDNILQIPSHEEGEDSQTLQVICTNADGAFTALNLKGWDAVLEWGLVTSAGDEYSPCAPVKCMSQTLSSDPNALLCYLTFAGIPNMLAEDKASKDYLHHKSDLKTVKALITEVADGQPVDTELTEEQTTYDSYADLKETTIAGSNYTLHGFGQRVSIPDRLVTHIAFRLKKTGSPSGTNVTFRIRDVETNDILASKTFPIASIGTSPTWCEATLDTPVQIDKEITYEGSTPVGGIWIYVEHTDGDASNYVSVSYNSFGVKPKEWAMLVDSVAGPVEYGDLECAYRYKYTADGVDCFTHCQAYEVVYDSEDSLIDSYQPKDALRIYEGDSRLAVINRLLGYTGCVKRFEDDGKMHVMVPVTSGVVFDSEYGLAADDHKFFSKSNREALVIPNKITVHSYKDDVDQYSGSATSAASYALLPKEEFIKAKLISNAQATAIAEARIAQLEMACQRGSARVPVNVGAEVHDYVKVTDARQSDSRTGNLGVIRRSYNPGTTWDMAFSFGKVALKQVPGTRPSAFEVVRPEMEVEAEAIVRYGSFYDILHDLRMLIWWGGGAYDLLGINQLADWIEYQLVPALEQHGISLDFIEDDETADEKIDNALMGYLRRLQDDPNPTLGADLDADSHKIVNLANGDIALVFTIDGGGAAITTGEKGHIRLPCNGEIISATMLADQTGSIVVDIWKDTYANFPPTDADSITASAPPTISAGQKSFDDTLTGWTKTFSEGDILAYNVDSVSTITRVTVSLRCRRT